MARKTISLQLSELREYTAKLEVELAGYKDILAVVNSKTPKVGRVIGMNELAREYCKAHNVKSASKADILAWRH